MPVLITSLFNIKFIPVRQFFQSFPISKFENLIAKYFKEKIYLPTAIHY